MNVYRIMLIGLLALAAEPRAPQAKDQASLASIRGVVMNAATNQPVAGAVVELTGIERGRVASHSVTTGKDGKFELRDLQPAKDYQLTAADSEYMPAAFGQHNSGDPWTPLALAAGQSITDIRLVLTPLSSITGKVVDGAGKPINRARVFVLRATYSAGRRELQRAGSFDTNSSGDYFIGRLGTGQYYIRVNPDNAADFQQLFENPSAWDQSRSPHKVGEPEGFPTVYYPGTTDLAQAKPVDLLNGGKAQGINIVAAKVRTRRVGGTVVTNPGAASTSQSELAARVLLVPRNAGPESSNTRSVNSQNGQFDFRGVLPGSYYLIAVTGEGRSQVATREPVDVADADLLKLSITVGRAFDLPGTIRFVDWLGGSPPDYSQLAINLIPDITAPVDKSFPGTRYTAAPLVVPPSSNGEFVLRNLAPGDYHVIVSINPKIAADASVPLRLRGAYMSSGRLGSADILDGGIHIEDNLEGRLEITVATTSGSVFGRVLDEDHEIAVPAQMVLIPDKTHRKRIDLFGVVDVSPTGRFTLEGIPPGDYKVFAWAHVEAGAWFDPEFIRVYEERGIPVHIEESGSYPLEIPLIH